MTYYYRIDVKDNIILNEHNVDEHSIPLTKFEVKFLRKVLENELLDNLLERLDYLRGALEAIDGIEIESYYALVEALVSQSFKTDFEIPEPYYYVHVLPGDEGYLNKISDDKFHLSDNSEWGNIDKNWFTKSEIEMMKQDERFKGINFDECLEEVTEDED